LISRPQPNWSHTAGERKRKKEILDEQFDRMTIFCDALVKGQILCTFSLSSIFDSYALFFSSFTIINYFKVSFVAISDDLICKRWCGYNEKPCISLVRWFLFLEWKSIKKRSQTVHIIHILAIVMHTNLAILMWAI